MALDKSSMATKIIAKLAVINPEITSSPVYQTYWTAIAEGIIEEITNNMAITTTVTIPGAQAGLTTLPGTGVDSSIS